MVTGEVDEGWAGQHHSGMSRVSGNPQAGTSRRQRQRSPNLTPRSTRDRVCGVTHAVGQVLIAPAAATNRPLIAICACVASYPSCGRRVRQPAGQRIAQCTMGERGGVSYDEEVTATGETEIARRRSRHAEADVGRAYAMWRRAACANSSFATLLATPDRARANCASISSRSPTL
jgi:hypothetical protein